MMAFLEVTSPGHVRGWIVTLFFFFLPVKL